MEAFHIRHSGLDPVSSTGQAPESRISFWIPAFAGMTNLISANIYATFSTTEMVQGLMPYDDAVKGTPSVTPANPGSGPGQAPGSRMYSNHWIPAFAGMTDSLELDSWRSDHNVVKKTTL